ncbi:MAG: urea carboxylase [Acidobacteriia bacterium]|nr:urea carboxylase [Terriglobia bacterium]
MFRKALVANRGAIAVRIMRTLGRMGVGSVAVYSEADRHSLHVERADEAVRIGPPEYPLGPAQSYLSVAALLEAARRTGAAAIHPGYGFLSESADFAEACASSGIVFIGPAPEQIRAFGLKHMARRIAAENGVPMLPGTSLLNSVGEALTAARQIGYPVMLKSTAGGGGIGMRLCESAAELAESYAAVERLSHASFGSGGLYLEKFVANARHIEVQIFGDGAGTVVALGERDCSAQRRNQKVIEETPAPGLDGKARSALFEAAVRLGGGVGYGSAGTVEFIYDNDTAQFYFLEVNTRLQVEHGVTEEVTGIDLVEWMVRLAAGELPSLRGWNVAPSGCSIQVRLYAEDPAKDFQPSAGRLSHVAWPARARVETWVESGSEVTPYFDPLLAKIIVRGSDRTAALAELRAALAECRIDGIETNLEYLRQVCADAAFAAGGITTSFLRGFDYRRNAVEVIDPGTQTTVQDYPGRVGYWHVGVPPSGPMDALAFRLANRLVGNDEDAAGLEITVTGPTLRFGCDTATALTGADFGARLDGAAVAPWQAVGVRAGSLLELGSAQGFGSRAYLAIAGGFDVPVYLDSRSTFILGRFGGHAGRPLRSGDVLHLRGVGFRAATPAFPVCGPASGVPAFVPSQNMPAGKRAWQAESPLHGTQWEIGVLYGPHGAPDFFTPADIETFFSTAWKVHHNSDRTGVRLIGPKPKWARNDGGEAGLHPSNIHDNAYAVGTIDFTGDMPVILGPDGPSLGGFVCPATIVHAELWKIGQLKPGDLVRFRAISLAQAREMERALDACVQTLSGELPGLPVLAVREEPVLRNHAASAAPSMVCRADGDRCMLVEYGPNVLDLNLRFRVHALENQLRGAGLPGILDVTPGVRSLHIHYDGRRLHREALLEALDACEKRIPDLDDNVVPSRIVHLPLSWDDPATQLAIRKYMQGVRPDAPWCPSNIEFIRRINGLESVEEVRRIVFAANYLVLGLGDVYLGAPVATPTDPRHRMVTTKYNPARTWTPENAVGIGGAYLCVYGMEGPGGYQFVGRTVQMWNTFRTTREFEPGTPWLLRFFDQIRFEPVSADELLEIRDAFPHGRYPLRIEDRDFRLKDYHAFLSSTGREAAQFKRRQQEAFEAERERWALAGADRFLEAPDESASGPRVEETVPEGCRPVCSPVTASVWNIAVETGQRVEAGQRLVVLEAMKMEIAVASPAAGTVERLNCTTGALVTAGQHLVTLRQEART